MALGTGFVNSPLTPGRRWHDAPSHDVQFYEDDDVLVRYVGYLLGSALAAGDVAIAIATKAHWADIDQWLRDNGQHPDEAAADGNLVALDADETLAKLLVDDWPDPRRFSDLIGGMLDRASLGPDGQRRRVVAFGEMVALLVARGNSEAALRLEGLWNDLARLHAFRLHCAYPLTIFQRKEDGEWINRICAEHGHVVPSETYTSLTDDEQRRREVAQLQQKALALEAEVEERRRAEELLRMRESELREALADRDEFLSVAAHELKTPITGLHAYAQLILRGLRRQRPVDPERLKSALSAIDRQSDKINQLILRLLDHSQIEAGCLRMTVAPTDLAQVVRSVIGQFEQPGTGAITFEGLDRLDVLVDPIRFEQVIANLLGNAVKYSPPGSPVQVSLEREPSGDVRLVVADHGIGVPAEAREAIFNRFHRAYAVRHTSGLGPGLYIAREIVKLHGGSLELEQLEEF